jgi:phage/plasmid-like protein (TIGR03299 family)
MQESTMSAEIYQYDHMYSAEITPWHRLGTVTDHALTPMEAEKVAHLDWPVSKHPVFTRVNRTDGFETLLSELLVAHQRQPMANFGELLEQIGFDIPVDGKFATVREDINYPLGIVGNDYTCFSNHALFELVEAVMAGGDIFMETAGSLNNGRRVFALARLDKEMRIDGDAHIPYLLFLSSHDGTSAIRVMPTPVRVVCANTLRMALEHATSSWTAHHTQSVTRRAAEARDTLKLGWQYYTEFESEVTKLIDKTVTDLEFENVLAAMVPDPEPDSDGKVSDRKLNNVLDKRGDIRTIYNLSPQIGDYKGTAWGVVQSFSTYDLWGGRVQGGENMRLERQASRVIQGNTMTNTSKVRELVLATAN